MKNGVIVDNNSQSIINTGANDNCQDLNNSIAKDYSDDINDAIVNGNDQCLKESIVDDHGDEGHDNISSTQWKYYWLLHYNDDSADEE